MPWRSTAQHVRTSDSSDAHFTQPIDSLQLEQIRRAQAVAAMSQTNAALVSEMCSDGQNWPQNSKTSKSNLSSGSDFVVSFYNRYYKIGATLKRGDHFSRVFTTGAGECDMEEWELKHCLAATAVDRTGPPPQVQCHTSWCDGTLPSALSPAPLRPDQSRSCTRFVPRPPWRPFYVSFSWW